MLNEYQLHSRNLSHIYFVCHFSLKQTFKTVFFENKIDHILNLYSCVVNSQRLFCIQKAGMKFYLKHSRQISQIDFNRDSNP